MLQRKTCGLHSSLCKLLWSWVSDRGQSLCKQDGQSWHSECVGTCVYCSSSLPTPPAWRAFCNHTALREATADRRRNPPKSKNLPPAPCMPTLADTETIWPRWGERGASLGGQFTHGSAYTWVYTVSGSVFYLLVKYQHHKERNSTKSTILTLHIPTITAEITQQFLSYTSAKKASVTNHLFFVGFFFFFGNSIS